MEQEGCGRSQGDGCRRTGREEGSGSILVIALAASVLLLTGLALPLNQALTVRQQVANAADAAALAAADTASGVVAGIPCENAAEAARLNGSALRECTIDGLEARVTATRSVLGVTVSVASRAGQPPEGAGAGRGPPGWGWVAVGSGRRHSARQAPVPAERGGDPVGGGE